MVLNPLHPPFDPISHPFPETFPSPSVHLTPSVLCPPQSSLPFPSQAASFSCLICPSLQSQPSLPTASTLLSTPHTSSYADVPKSTTLTTPRFCSVLTRHFHVGIHPVYLICRPTIILFYFVSALLLGACHSYAKHRGCPCICSNPASALEGWDDRHASPCPASHSASSNDVAPT